MKRTEVRVAMAGKPDFHVPGYEFVVDGIALVVHQISPLLGWGSSQPVGWSITEPISGRGLGICFAATRDAARQSGEEQIRKLGPEKFRAMIRRAVTEAPA